MERSVHDALCVVKRVLESNTVVPGGGAVETALSMYLENFATSIVSIRYSLCRFKYVVLSRLPENSLLWQSLPVPC